MEEDADTLDAWCVGPATDDEVAGSDDGDDE